MVDTTGATQSAAAPKASKEKPVRTRLVSFAIVLAVMVASLIGAQRVIVPPPKLLQVVNAVVGTESQILFDDPDMMAALAAHGFRVRLQAEGSRQMATAADTCHYDFALPSSQPAGEKVRQKCGIASAYPAFSSPMVVVTFTDIAELLRREGIATQDKAGIWHFDVARYLELVQSGLKWDQIPGNATHVSPNRMLVATTDPKTSNSAAMYVGMASYVLNHYLPVTQPAEVPCLAKVIGQLLFLNQGFTQPSTQDPFADYHGSLNESLAPMLWAYEAQYLDDAVNNKDVITRAHEVIMYPTPTVSADRTVVPITSLGNDLGRLLSGEDYDPAIMRLEAKHGFRTRDPQDTFSAFINGHVANVPTALNIGPLPIYERFEDLLNAIAAMYQGQLPPC